MKYCLLIAIVFLFLSSCFANPEGRIVFYDFNSPKAVVEKELYAINTDSSGGVLIGEGDKNVDISERIYVSFKNEPKEMYEIGFTCDSMVWNTSPASRLGLIGQNDGGKWQFARDMDKAEEERVQKRFETEVLSKLGEGYTKSDETGSCP